jgi:hypothetical protein
LGPSWDSFSWSRLLFSAATKDGFRSSQHPNDLVLQEFKGKMGSFRGVVKYFFGPARPMGPGVQGFAKIQLQGFFFPPAQ